MSEDDLALSFCFLIVGTSLSKVLLVNKIDLSYHFGIAVRIAIIRQSFYLETCILF